MNETPRPPILSRSQRFGAVGVAPAPKRIVPASPSPGYSPSVVVGAPLRQVVPAVQAAPNEVTGLLERITVYGSWAVGSIFSEDRKAVNITGEAIKELVEGNEYTFKGRFINHHKYGEQLEVSSAMPFVRPDRPSIVKYITRNFKGVGPVTAEKFVTRRLDAAPDKAVALEAIRQQLLEAPWTLDFTGVTKKAQFKSEEDSSPVLAYVHRDLATRLGGMQGMRDSILKMLASHLLAKTVGKKEGASKTASLDPLIIQKCWATLIQDPYDPISSVPGYAFSTADLIGASVNIPRDAPARLKALVVHALDLGCKRGGHVYLTSAQLISAISSVDSRVPADRTISFGLSEEMIQLDDEFGEKRYYTPDLYDAESCLARRIATLCRDSRPLSTLHRTKLEEKIQEVAKRVAPAMKEGLDPSQLKALVGMLTSKSRLHTLTAGPGCGKTALMEVLSEVLKEKDFTFCGPTGKSAKVLNNRLSAHGRTANTIHTTLQGSGRKDFQVGEDTPLEGDVLVMDEGSMSDVEIADALFAAANNRMHVIVLGDTNQLASIGPGTFLSDIVSIPEADHHRLTTTHRNSGGILDVIEQVRHGSIDCENREAVKFSGSLGSADYNFGEVAQKYISAVSKHGYEHAILIMSMRKGDPVVPGWNTTYANAVLRDLCNPNAEKIPGTRLFVGDRIILKENMTVKMSDTSGKRRHKKDDDEEDDNNTRVVNGDTGSIVAYERDQSSNNAGPSVLRLKLDDGRMVDFPGSACQLVDHSYALTVHAAQGSEYKHVSMVVTPGHEAFMNRTMLFTGLSRPRMMLDINADDAVLRKVAATPAPKRNSGLVQRVRNELSGNGSRPSKPRHDPDDDDDVFCERSAVVGQKIAPAPVVAEPAAQSKGSFRDMWAQRRGG